MHVPQLNSLNRGGHNVRLDAVVRVRLTAWPFGTNFGGQNQNRAGMDAHTDRVFFFSFPGCHRWHSCGTPGWGLAGPENGYYYHTVRAHETHRVSPQTRCTDYFPW